MSIKKLRSIYPSQPKNRRIPLFPFETPLFIRMSSFNLPFAAQEPETVGPDPLEKDASVDREPDVAHGVREDGDER